MNSLVKTLLLGALAGTAGCVVTTASLREVGVPASDDGLCGVWELVRRPEPFGATKGPRYQITRDDQGEYFIQEHLHDGESEKDPMGVVELNGTVYAQTGSDEVVEESGSEDAAGYFFPYRLERRGDWLAISRSSHDALNQALADSGLQFQEGRWTLVDCSPQELADFLTKYGNKIYTERYVYRRVSDAVNASGVNH